MLERASTCLESSGRHLFRTSKQCLHSRRMLHSHFWHHGASDISLPIWWAATSILEPPNGDVRHPSARKTASAASRYHDGTLLDFLYPEKTLALLKTLSSYDAHAPKPRRQRLYPTSVRGFSTIQVQSGQDGSTEKNIMADQTKKEIEVLLLGSDPVAELGKILHARKSGKQDLAWQLYVTIPEDEHVRTGHWLRKDLLDYLVQDDGALHAARVLHLFGELPELKRRSSSYRAAILAYLELDMIGPAIQLLEAVDRSRNFDMQKLGIDLVLQRTVLEEQWDLCLRVFRTFLRHTPRLRGNPTNVQIRYGDILPDTWRQVTYLPELLEHLQSFFHYVREFRDEMQSSRERQMALSCFVMTFIPHVMGRVLNVRTPDENFIWDWFIQLFDDLHSLKLPTSACYEHAIKQMLDLPRYQNYTNKRKIWLELYRRYRQHYLYQENTSFETKPSENLIRRLIVHHGHTNGLKRIEDHVQDLRSFYPDRPLRPGLLKYLIIAYADNGDDSHVNAYFEELRKHYTEEVDLKVLSALLHVYARRANVDQTNAQFRRMHSEFGVTPDTACWNIVLNAYVRADDLDGALECFNTCLDRGIVPDLLTFGPLLDFCAQRGDVEAFEALFSKGKQMGVALDTDVRARSGYVQATLNAGDPDGAFAIAQGMLKSWQAGLLRGNSLTHTWNLLIQHYALDGDLAASRECYKQMVDHSIPLDSWTYGSLMRALVEVKQTNAAYKILRVTMPQNNLRVHALHYAIVMAGFVREGQTDLAVQAYERMMSRQVPQTESSRQATIQALGTADLEKLRQRGAKHPNYRLLKVEEALQDMLIASTGPEVASREPRHAKYLDTRSPISVPQTYYALLVSLYTARSAHKITSKLLKDAEQAAPGADNYTMPITLITASMEASLKAGKYAEVASSWNVARTAASKLVKTFHRAVHPEHVTPEFSSLIDPSIRERFEQARISDNRRYILVRAARLYIRSLLAQPGPSCIQEAQRTIHDLLVNGFTVDTFTWNEFIQHLAQHDRLVDAFTICEAYLMPHFPGWRDLRPNYVRRERPGYQWMDIRHYELKKTSVLPRYKTLVIFAQVFGQVKADERNGIGYDKEAGAWMREILEESAPMTVRAIESMPRTNDRLQWKYVHDSV